MTKQFACKAKDLEQAEHPSPDSSCEESSVFRFKRSVIYIKFTLKIFFTIVITNLLYKDTYKYMR